MRSFWQMMDAMQWYEEIHDDHSRGREARKGKDCGVLVMEFSTFTLDMLTWALVSGEKYKLCWSRSTSYMLVKLSWQCQWLFIWWNTWGTLPCMRLDPFKWMHFNSFCGHCPILVCSLQCVWVFLRGYAEEEVLLFRCLVCWCALLGLQVGQVHGGLMGVIQRATVKACPHVWFERSEIKDRHLVTKRWGVDWSGELQC